MNENEQLASLINKDLGNQEEGMLIPLSGLDLNMIREKLAILIEHMLQDNFEKLCQAMYRLDVSETKFHQVMTEQPFENIPSSIADLIIEREMQKVRTRMMHKRGEL
jgi:hypothetical protein